MQKENKNTTCPTITHVKKFDTNQSNKTDHGGLELDFQADIWNRPVLETAGSGFARHECMVFPISFMSFGIDTEGHN